jgi:hypothetical protein
MSSSQEIPGASVVSIQTSIKPVFSQALTDDSVQSTHQDAPPTLWI